MLGQAVNVRPKNVAVLQQTPSPKTSKPDPAQCGPKKRKNADSHEDEQKLKVQQASFVSKA